MHMTVIDPYPDPAQQLALLGLLLLGPLGYAAVARWRVALVPVVVLAGACAWVRLPLALAPIMYMHAHGAPVDHGILWTGVAMEAAFFVWAVGWAGIAFVRQDARIAD